MRALTVSSIFCCDELIVCVAPAALAAAHFSAVEQTAKTSAPICAASAGRARDQYALALLQPALRDEPVVGGHEPDRIGRGFIVAVVRRGQHDLVGRADALFGEAAGLAPQDHAVADLHLRAISCLDHFAGGFEARHEGRRRLCLVLAGDHQQVRKVHAAGMDSHARLAGLQHGRLEFLDAKDFRAAQFGADDGAVFHMANLSPLSRHCEEHFSKSDISDFASCDEAIQSRVVALDCFAALAMTGP